MEVNTLAIPDVKLIIPQVVRDERGAGERSSTIVFPIPVDLLQKIKS